jgi:hypothetical protein
LATRSTLAACDQPGSAALKPPNTSSKYTPQTPTSSQRASWINKAIFSGSGVLDGDTGMGLAQLGTSTDYQYINYRPRRNGLQGSKACLGGLCSMLADADTSGHPGMAAQY